MDRYGVDLWLDDHHLIGKDNWNNVFELEFELGLYIDLDDLDQGKKKQRLRLKKIRWLYRDEIYLKNDILHNIIELSPTLNTFKRWSQTKP